MDAINFILTLLQILKQNVPQKQCKISSTDPCEVDRANTLQQS